LLALPVFANPDRAVFTDSTQYLNLADSLRLTGQYSGTDWEEKMRPPGYPLFLAAIRAIAPSQLGLVSLIQLLVTSGTAYLIYRCGKALGGKVTGLAGALVYALNPNALFWSLSILTETLFSFMLVLSLFLLIQARQKEKLSFLAGSGLALSFAVLIRPIGLLLLPVWAVFVIVIFRPNQFRKVLLYGGVFLVSSYCLIFAWQVHNSLVKGQFFFSASANETYQGYISADTLGDALSIDRESAKQLIAQQSNPDAYSLRVPWMYPLSFLKVTLVGEARTLLGVEAGTWLKLVSDIPYQGSGILGNLLHGDPANILPSLASRLFGQGEWASLLLIAWGTIYSLVLYLLFLIGCVHLLRSGRWEVRWLGMLILVSALYLLLSPLGDGDARFRVPGEPLLAILAGLAFLKIKEMRSNQLALDEPLPENQ
jgi:4-amino-4-deoxy-L-arabinose transferase-like glycosyltransferase